MSSQGRHASPSTTLVSNQILDTLRDVVPPPKAKAQAKGLQEKAQKPPAVNPVELMWAHQLRREHAHLLSRIDGLSTSVSSLEQQQAAQSGEFCTIQNLEHARASDATENKETVAKLQKNIEALEESSRAAVLDSRASLDKAHETWILPLTNRTTSVERDYAKLENEIAGLKASLDEHDRHVARIIGQFTDQLRLVTERLLQQDISKQQPCPEELRNGKGHDVLSSNSIDPALANDPLNSDIVAMSAISERRDSAISLSQNNIAEAEWKALPHVHCHSRSFSQATTVDEDTVKDQKQNHQQELVVDQRSATDLLSSLLVKEAFKPKISRLARGERLMLAHAKDKLLGGNGKKQIPTPPSPQKPRKRRPMVRRSTEMVPDSVCGSQGLRMDGPSRNAAASKADIRCATLAIRGPGTQNAEVAYVDESQTRQEPASPTRPSRKTETETRHDSRTVFCAGQRHASKRKPVLIHDTGRADKASQQAPEKRRRRTIPKTVQELAAEFARERELGGNMHAAKWGGSMAGVKV